MRRLPALALALALGWAAAAAAGQEGPGGRPEFIILDYHSFLGNGTSNIDFSLEELASHLDHLARSGFRFVRLEEALAGRIEGRNNVVVTIDDGHKSIYRAFREVFEPRGIKPFLFVYPAIVENRVRYALTPEELAELAAAGCGIGAHGYNHSSLSEKAWKKDYVQFNRELKQPGPTLERLTGIRPGLYAYPFGVKSERAAAQLPELGYGRAFVADDALHPIAIGDPELDPLALPRTIMYRHLAAASLSSMTRRLALTGEGGGKAE